MSGATGRKARAGDRCPREEPPVLRGRGERSPL